MVFSVFSFIHLFTKTRSLNNFSFFLPLLAYFYDYFQTTIHSMHDKVKKKKLHTMQEIDINKKTTKPHNSMHCFHLLHWNVLWIDEVLVKLARTNAKMYSCLKPVLLIPAQSLFMELSQCLGIAVTKFPFFQFVWVLFSTILLFSSFPCILFPFK